ncbi:MAG TPA: M20 family metallo-hydrolase [Clostridia bacterium]|nr:M20 family metallo-hydrolase [Clostridia bacterium]
MKDISRKITENIEKMLEELKQFNSTPDNGITRLPFTKEAKDAADYILDKMQKAGLNAFMDESGAVVGRIEGESSKTIIVASHYDTVRNGGAYDGIAGIVCGIQAAELLLKEKQQLKYSLEIIATNDEEGVRFKSGFFTAKALLEGIDISEMKSLEDSEGITLYNAMKNSGLSPEKLSKAKRDTGGILGFLEVHIEQGPILEKYGKDIGIVDSIVGLKRAMVTITGRADHAGTTPMDARQDAMEAAAIIISRLGYIARKYQNAVATVGSIKAFPNEVNIICRQVCFSLDIRAEKDETIINIFGEIEKVILEVTKERNVSYSIEGTLDVKPAVMNAGLIKLAVESCRSKGYSFMHMNSGAGHDSLVAAPKVPAAMIFVPSWNGRSHCEEEYTDSRYLTMAVEVVKDIVTKMNK